MPWDFGKPWTPVYQDTSLAKLPKPTLAEMLAPQKSQGSISATKRTLGQIINTKVAGALKPMIGKATAQKAADLLDYSPVAAVSSAFGLGQDLRASKYGSAAANAVDTALNFIPDGKLAAGVAHSIIAPLWHGSPHKFEKFALEKIGTGEGAQAYGHGLYFAENPAVAKEYQRTLGGIQVNDTDPVGAEAYAHGAVQQYGSAQAALKAHLDYIKQTGWHAPEETATLQKWAKDGAPKLGTGGHLYQVKLDANPEDFLDWDAPLAQQPASDKLRGALTNLNMHPSIAANDETLGSQLYRSHFDSGIIPRGSPYSGLDKMRAPTMLNDAGVKGISYLDQGSRMMGNGTRNYVVFDPSIIDITHRY